MQLFFFGEGGDGIMFIDTQLINDTLIRITHTSQFIYSLICILEYTTFIHLKVQNKDRNVYVLIYV